MVEIKSDYRVIFLVGAPGSGKNTLCDMLKLRYNIKHFGAGDLLREEMKSGSEVGNYIAGIVNEGKIVPVKITVGLVKKKMELLGKENIFLIDGYPRNKDNIDGWNEVFDGSEGSRAEILCLLNLECSEEVCQDRLINRSLTSGRSDDQIETIKKRFKTHTTECVIIELMSKVTTIISISSEETPEKVYQKACEELDKLNVLTLNH